MSEADGRFLSMTSLLLVQGLLVRTSPVGAPITA
jgi:hypothetical protein